MVAATIWMIPIGELGISPPTTKVVNTIFPISKRVLEVASF